MFKSRHAIASAVGPIVTKVATGASLYIPNQRFTCQSVCTEQPESWIQICTKNTIKSHLKKSQYNVEFMAIFNNFSQTIKFLTFARRDF